MHELAELWEFDTSVAYHDFGRMGYAVVYLPENLRHQLPFDKHPRLRVNADILGYSIDGAFQPGQGKIYLILSKKFLKEVGLEIGDHVTVQFSVADQNAVSVPPELEAALSQNKIANAAWEKLSPGKQRGLAHQINTAKTKATIDKRVNALIDQLSDSN